MENFLKVATKAEIQFFLGSDSTLEMAKSVIPPDSDTEKAYLARLYDARGDKKMSNKYLESIEDKQYRLDTTLIINEMIE